MSRLGSRILPDFTEASSWRIANKTGRYLVDERGVFSFQFAPLIFCDTMKCTDGGVQVLERYRLRYRFVAEGRDRTSRKKRENAGRCDTRRNRLENGAELSFYVQTSARTEGKSRRKHRYECKNRRHTLSLLQTPSVSWRVEFSFWWRINRSLSFPDFVSRFADETYRSNKKMIFVKRNRSMRRETTIWWRVHSVARKKSRRHCSLNPLLVSRQDLGSLLPERSATACRNLRKKKPRAEQTRPMLQNRGTDRYR